MKFLVVLAAVAGALIVSEVLVGRAENGKFPPPQPCMAWQIPYYHHTYRGECDNGIYNYNEDGFRDHVRQYFNRGAIAVLGDSVVEGIYLPEEKTLPKVLEKQAGDIKGAHFLNLGLRASSPLIQTRRLDLAAQKYMLRAVIWSLNGTDPFEERYFLSLLKGGDLHYEFFDLAYARVFKILRKVTMSFNSALIESAARRSRLARWSSKGEATAATKGNLCAAIYATASKLKAQRVPLLFVFTPHPQAGLDWNWGSTPYNASHLALMKECAHDTGAPVVDLTTVTPQPDWYEKDSFHFSEAGINWLAAQMKAPVAELLR